MMKKYATASAHTLPSCVSIMFSVEINRNMYVASNKYGLHVKVSTTKSLDRDNQELLLLLVVADL